MIAKQTSIGQIPAVLTGSPEFRSLSSVQQENFAARLGYIEELYVTAQEWINSGCQQEAVADLLDDLEQGLLINIGSGDKNREVSPWLIHSSWTFNCSAQSLLESLPKSVRSSLAEPSVGFDCDLPHFCTWLRRHVDSLRLLIEKFYGSTTLADAIGSLIGIDICMSVILVGVSKQRMNTNFSRTYDEE